MEKPLTYFLQRGDGLVKIGKARSERLHTRWQELCRMAGEQLAFLGVDDVDELALHARFSHLRRIGEWFAPGLDLLEYIRDHVFHCDPMSFAPRRCPHCGRFHRVASDDAF